MPGLSKLEVSRLGGVGPGREDVAAAGTPGWLPSVLPSFLFFVAVHSTPSLAVA